MIDAVIVENEPPQIEYITGLIKKKFPEVRILAVCDNVPDGVTRVRELKPELIFLDIDLPPHTGFNLLEQTRGMDYEVIFTTSFNQFALQAIKFCALDYIEKPFGDEELKEAINRYKNRRGRNNGLSKLQIDTLLNNLHLSKEKGQQIGLPILGGIDFIQVDLIVRCQSCNNYTDLFLQDGRRITVTRTLKIVEDLLKDHQFFRIHDSHMINLNHIKRYMKGGEGGVVIMSDKSETDVSRRRKDGFVRELRKRGML